MSTTNASIIDTLPLLEECLIHICPEPLPDGFCLAIDVEGIDLCRNGQVALVQVMSNISPVVWLIDVAVLGSDAFNHAAPGGKTLKAVLEDISVKKVFYDVRNDVDAFFNIYDVDMQNVYDLQVLEVAVRRSKGMSVKFVIGLSKAIQHNLAPPSDWQLIKSAGHRLFAPELGGTYSVFTQRPIDPRILAYCAQDVTLLLQLEAALHNKFGTQGKNWQSRVIAASASRVAKARSSVYEGEGRHKAIAPMI